MNYFLFGDIKELFKIVSLSKKTPVINKVYNQTFDEFIVNYACQNTLIIYGINQTADEIFDALTSANIVVNYFCDPIISKDEYRGIRVIKPMN